MLVKNELMARGSDSQLRMPVVHRLPTEAMVKQLYATAFRCGKPECTKPLYRMSDDTGEYILNSRVAHIHARSEGGPRWDGQMSEADNRRAANLIPLCEEHAFEIDVTPEHFPADDLFEWKARQLAEYQRIQKSWPLNDDEAAEVIRHSFRSDTLGVAAAGAEAMLAAARAVGMLMEIARQQRRGPQHAARAWQARRNQVNASLFAWDSNGERLVAEPPLIETAQLRDSLQAALARAVEHLEPLAAAALADLHAVRTAKSSVARWCDWVATATESVVEVSGRWPAPGYEDDDQVLAAALDDLRRASAALGAAWRGETAEQPPLSPSPSAEPEEDEQQRSARKHRALLESARPWSRVEHRPYDADLYGRLRQALSYAIEIPPLPSFLAIDLHATARLAAAVARNADDATFAELIEQAATLQQLAAAVALLQQLALIAEKSNRSELGVKATEAATQLLRQEAWVDSLVWEMNRFHAKTLLDRTASITGDDSVSATIVSALNDNCELLVHILKAAAQWSEQRDTFDFSRILGTRESIDQLPSWFPLQRIVAEIHSQLPDLVASPHEDADPYDTDLRNLAHQKTNGKRTLIGY